LAKGSHPPTFAQYGVERRCYGCGRKLKATEPLWFEGGPKPAVYGWRCNESTPAWCRPRKGGASERHD